MKTKTKKYTITITTNEYENKTIPKTKDTKP